MNEDIDSINRMRAVTISREYGSGGGEIATRLAKRLGWQLVDHALVERVAREIGTSQEEAEVHDEHIQGMVSRALGSLIYLSPAVMASAPPEAFLSVEAYRDAFNRVVRAAAARGHVVIVGRASLVILAALRAVLRVRIIAPFEKRVVYVMILPRFSGGGKGGRDASKGGGDGQTTKNVHPRVPSGSAPGGQEQRRHSTLGEVSPLVSEQPVRAFPCACTPPKRVKVNGGDRPSASSGTLLVSSTGGK